MSSIILAGQILLETTGGSEEEIDYGLIDPLSMRSKKSFAPV